MLLIVDIGNTNINFGICNNNRIIKKFFIPTKNYSCRNLPKKIGKIKIDDAIICSVVPKITKAAAADFKKIFHLKPYVLGKNISVPIKNLYRNPKQVGQDRLVNAYAGVKLFGAPLIAVDFGTAITFDIISKNKEYLGGIILPGFGISLDALYKKTALLPKVKLGRPKEFIGRDTKQSILSGVIYGFSTLTDGLILKLKERLGKGTKTAGTGGNIRLIAKYCRQIDKVDPDLTLKGLNLIYQRRRGHFPLESVPF